MIDVTTIDNIRSLFGGEAARAAHELALFLGSGKLPALHYRCDNRMEPLDNLAALLGIIKDADTFDGEAARLADELAIQLGSHHHIRTHRGSHALDNLAALLAIVIGRDEAEPDELAQSVTEPTPHQRVWRGWP